MAKFKEILQKIILVIINNSFRSENPIKNIIAYAILGILCGYSFDFCYTLLRLIFF
jgi:hypothetical protein